MKIIRDDTDIDKLIVDCPDGLVNTNFPECSYEQGILYLYWWLVGDTDVHPLEKEG